MARKQGLDRQILDTFVELVEAGTIKESEIETGQVSRVFQGLVRDLGGKMLGSLRASKPATLDEHREIRQGFEERLRDIWGEAIDALEIVYIACSEAGETIAREDRRRAADIRFSALVRIHARACAVTTEILSLLRSGHASGAHARWRTLHELAVVAWFLKEHDPIVAERYLLHADVLRAARLPIYQKYAEQLGDVPLSPEEEQAVRDRRDAVLATVSDPKGFKTPWGWAADALGKKEPKFDQLLEAVKLDHWRPWVSLAHYPVHAGSGALEFDLGDDSGGKLLLAGASNAGLADPGHSAAISLYLVTVPLLLYRPSAERAMTLVAIDGLVEDVGAAFAAGEEDYDKRKAADEARRAARRERRQRTSSARTGRGRR